MATAGRPLTRVIEVASLKVGRIAATSPSVTRGVGDAATGMLSTSSGVSISAGHLDRETALRAFQRAGGDEAVALRRGADELVERDAVALQEHRLGDDLDDLVARALELGRSTPGTCSIASWASRAMRERALGQVAGQASPR